MLTTDQLVRSFATIHHKCWKKLLVRYISCYTNYSTTRIWNFHKFWSRYIKINAPYLLVNHPGDVYLASAPSSQPGKVDVAPQRGRHKAALRMERFTTIGYKLCNQEILSRCVHDVQMYIYIYTYVILKCVSEWYLFVVLEIRKNEVWNATTSTWSGVWTKTLPPGYVAYAESPAKESPAWRQKHAVSFTKNSQWHEGCANLDAMEYPNKIGQHMSIYNHP